MAGSRIDRVWSIRDGVLKWLYLKTTRDGIQVPVLEAQDVAKTVDWQGDPLSSFEVAQASDWLLARGYFSGTSSWGAGVIRPSITPQGEEQAGAGRSVRGGNQPANPQGTPGIHISTGANPAVNSPGIARMCAFTEQIEKAIAVADALESSTRGSPEKVAAHDLASQIKAEVAQGKPDKSRLKELLMSAVTVGTAALGEEAAINLIRLAGQALQAF